MQNTTQRVCAFCGNAGDPNTSYAGGFGVLMCAECVDYFHAHNHTSNGARAAEDGQTRDGGSRDGAGWLRPTTRRPVDDLSNDEMLATLPRIAGTAQHANRYMAEWVEQIRERKLSWTAIGNAMGISRQAAWERFTRVLGTERNPTPR